MKYYLSNTKIQQHKTKQDKL